MPTITDVERKMCRLCNVHPPRDRVRSATVPLPRSPLALPTRKRERRHLAIQAVAVAIRSAARRFDPRHDKQASRKTTLRQGDVV